MLIFPCDNCGKCCQYVNLSEETKWLDRGDGICRHLDENTKFCLIYDDRPDICNVKFQYKKNYAQNYTWQEFVDLNVQVCSELKKMP
ncbi:MAG: YkgJ family cysteine cluster protein [Algicola sp.]|nr:YkgJ family cysteine cluster protein [Algicola sp.]